MLVILHVYLSTDFFFLKINYFKIFIREYNQCQSLDPDQARHFNESDLGPKCLQRLSVHITSKQRG